MNQLSPRNAERLFHRPDIDGGELLNLPRRRFSIPCTVGIGEERARGFADHHSFSETDIAELESEADAGGLELVTTAKDAVRLRGGSPAAKALAERTLVLEIDLAFDDPRVPSKIVDRTLEAFARRQHGVSRTA